MGLVISVLGYESETTRMKRSILDFFSFKKFKTSERYAYTMKMKMFACIILLFLTCCLFLYICSDYQSGRGPRPRRIWMDWYIYIHIWHIHDSMFHETTKFLNQTPNYIYSNQYNEWFSVMLLIKEIIMWK